MPTVVDRLLSRFRLKRSDVAHWVSDHTRVATLTPSLTLTLSLYRTNPYVQVVHSGGKKVLDCVQSSLGLTRHDLRHSLATLEAMGNMSSCSFLWAYDALLKEEKGAACRPGDFGVFITMGPGAGIEACLWRLPQ